MVNSMNRRNLLSLILSAGLVSTMAAPAAMASGKKAEKKKGGGEAFIQFPMIAVFVPSGGYRNSTLTIEIGLDVPDEKFRDVVSTYVPRLRDAYVSRIQSYAMTLGGSKLVDTDYLQRELQAITNAQLKAPGAKLLLGSIMVN
jgi:flagellar basal body-associated protein FliL